MGDRVGARLEHSAGASGGPGQRHRARPQLAPACSGTRASPTALSSGLHLRAQAGQTPLTPFRTVFVDYKWSPGLT